MKPVKENPYLTQGPLSLVVLNMTSFLSGTDKMIT